jgi:hypothetical protein
MLIPFGVLSAAGADVGPVFEDAYELISSTILTANASSVTFGSLGTYSSTYKHLQIRHVSKTSFVGSFNIRLNGITTSSYAKHELNGNGSSVGANNAINRTSIELQGNTTNADTANSFGVGIVDILDSYSSSKNTTIRSLHGKADAANFVALQSGLFNNTASLTEISLFVSSGNFVAGSRFSLYGIKG